MPNSVNEDILSAEIDHQVEVQRMIQGVVSDLRGTLTDGQEQILEEVLSQEEAINQAQDTKRWQALLSALLLNIKTANDDSHAAMNQDFAGYVQDFISYETDFQVSILDEMTPDSVDITTPDTGVIDQSYFDTPILGRYFDQWMGDYRDASYDRDMQAVQSGAVSGSTADEIVSALRDGAFLVGERQLINVTRTLFNSAANTARQAVADANPDVFGAVQWHATLDSSTCIICADLDGEVFASEDEVPEDIPAHPSCRCFLVPVTMSAMKMGLTGLTAEARARMNGQPAKTQRYAAWLERRSAGRQDEILGPSRGRLFRIGKLPLSKFTDSHHSILTLKELKARHAEKFKRANVGA